MNIIMGMYMSSDRYEGMLDNTLIPVHNQSYDITTSICMMYAKFVMPSVTDAKMDSRGGGEHGPVHEQAHLRELLPHVHELQDERGDGQGQNPDQEGAEDNN